MIGFRFGRLSKDILEKTSSKSWNSLRTDSWKGLGGAEFFAKASDSHCEVVALTLINSTGSWIVVIKTRSLGSNSSGFFMSLSGSVSTPSGKSGIGSAGSSKTSSMVGMDPVLQECKCWTSIWRLQCSCLISVLQVLQRAGHRDILTFCVFQSTSGLCSRSHE